jgi:hypothetical protein
LKQSLRIRVLAALFFAILAGSLAVSSSVAFSPPYAQQGAEVIYDITGGSVAFFAGVNGTLSYQVVSIDSGNGSMMVMRNQTVAEGGTEAAVAPTTSNSTIFPDSIFEPKIFPAVPIQNLTSVTLEFQNVTCSRLNNESVTVPLGNFNTVEFEGKSANDTVEYFWFDWNTGVLIQARTNVGSIIQLTSSSFAVPVSVPSPFLSSLPFIAFFVVLWGLFIGFFFWIRRHYASKAKKLNAPAKSTVKKKSS